MLDDNTLLSLLHSYVVLCVSIIIIKSLCIMNLLKSLQMKRLIYIMSQRGKVKVKIKVKVHPCTGTEAQYRPYGP